VIVARCVRRAVVVTVRGCVEIRVVTYSDRSVDRIGRVGVTVMRRRCWRRASHGAVQPACDPTCKVTSQHPSVTWIGQVDCGVLEHAVRRLVVTVKEARFESGSAESRSDRPSGLVTPATRTWLWLVERWNRRDLLVLRRPS